MPTQSTSKMAWLAIAIVSISFLLDDSFSFTIPQSKNILFGRGHAEANLLQTKMAGMGMGATLSKKKKSGGKKKKSKSPRGSSFDVSKSMLKSEKLYDELLKEAKKVSDEDHKDFGTTITSEYVIAARINPDENSDSIPGASSLCDWVPVGQLCLTRPIEPDNDDESAREKMRLCNAISFYCREISCVATRGSSLFQSIPRNLIQYSAEDIESFHKYVYEDVIEGKNNDDKNDDVMTKAEARKVLKLADDCNDLSEIKKSYRKMSMTLHPDRFVGVERSEEEEEKTNDEFGKVKIAYESLQSGVRAISDGGKKVQSWYESLGGRSRTEFIGPIDLVSVEKAKLELSRRSHKSAICGLTPETVMAFVTRNQVAN
jgi:hypothetical protein